MDQLVFTPAGLMDFLAQIDELKDYTLSIDETAEQLTLVIGDSQYVINKNDAEDVEVPAEVLDEVAEVNDDTYDVLVSQDDIQLDDSVEGGPIVELLKTLAVGGMVRFGAKQLGRDAAKAAEKSMRGR